MVYKTVISKTAELNNRNFFIAHVIIVTATSIQLFIHFIMSDCLLSTPFIQIYDDDDMMMMMTECRSKSTCSISCGFVVQ